MFLIGKGKGTYSRLLGVSVPLSELLQLGLLLHGKIWEFLNFGLVEPVDNGILSLWDMYLLDLRGRNKISVLELYRLGTILKYYLSIVLETNLSDGHTPVFLQV